MNGGIKVAEWQRDKVPKKMASKALALRHFGTLSLCHFLFTIDSK